MILLKNLIGLYSAGLELTLACPCRCETCGSSAGKKRARELDAGQWFKVLSSLETLGCKRVGLLGGEPLLYPEWPAVARAAKEKGMAVEMITSGVGFREDTVQKMTEAGLVSVTVSVDGTEAIHDAQRRVDGGFQQSMAAIREMDKAGIKVGVNTQINTRSLPTLDTLASTLESAGVLGWQLQLTLPRGRAAEDIGLSLPPEAMPEVLAALRRLVKRPGLRPFITDNIGYMTKDDPVLRTPPRISSRCWLGCFAGLRVVGITSDGNVKGCLALPDEAVEGNILHESLEAIWNDPTRFAYNRSFEPAALSGDCATCKFGNICRGGCTAAAMTIHGKPNVSTHCFRLHA